MLRQVLLVWALGSPLMAQNAAWTNLQDRLRDKLAGAFPLPRTASSQQEVLILANPGLAMESLADPSGCALAQLLDAIPLPGTSYAPSGFSVSKVYHDLLFASELPMKWDSRARTKAKEAMNLLYEPGSLYKPSALLADYQRCKDHYDEAVDNLSRTPLRWAGWGINPVYRSAQQTVAVALNDWETLGHRAQVDQAMAAVAALQNQKIYTLFADLQRDLEQYEGDAVDLEGYETDVHPSAGQWLADAGWAPFTFNADDALREDGRPIVNNPEPTFKVIGVPRNAGLPPFPPPPEFIATLSLTADLKRVYVSRPWMDLGVFHSTQWRLAGLSYTTISTGNPMDADPGVMPLFVAGLLLGRRFVLTGDWGEQQAANPEALPSFGPWAFLGPWLASGSLHPTVSRDVEGRMTIAVDGAQIIGFFCQVIPKSPTPDSMAFPEP